MRMTNLPHSSPKWISRPERAKNFVEGGKSLRSKFATQHPSFFGAKTSFLIVFGLCSISSDVYSGRS